MRLGTTTRLSGLAAATALALTACGTSDAEGPSGPLASGSDGPDASAAAEALPKPEAPPAEDSRKGRAAFATYVVMAIDWGFTTNDASAVTSVATTRTDIPCVACDNYADRLADEKAEGRTFEPSVESVSKVFETAQPQPGVYVLTALAERRAYDQVDEQGQVTESFPAGTLTYEIGVTYEQGQMRVTGFRTTDGETS